MLRVWRSTARIRQATGHAPHFRCARSLQGPLRRRGKIGGNAPFSMSKAIRTPGIKSSPMVRITRVGSEPGLEHRPDLSEQVVENNSFSFGSGAPRDIAVGAGVSVGSMREHGDAVVRMSGLIPKACCMDGIIRDMTACRLVGMPAMPMGDQDLPFRAKESISSIL